MVERIRVKVFTAGSSFGLEREMNIWLEKMSKRGIGIVMMTTSGRDHGCVIMYKERMESVKI